MKILITGGAGYIGSFMVRGLLEKGDEVCVIDSLERGHKENIASKAKFYQGTLLDKDFISKVFSENKFDAIVHFAGYISMAESVKNPYIYFENNVFSSLNLMEEMIKTKTDNFIFSSSAGVYGNPKEVPIPENNAKKPGNPYGESKLMVERIMSWYQKSYNLSSVALRYFNAAGASLNADLGEDHSPETHIIPNVIGSIINNKSFKLFGTDYETKDGTCVRDYIHVLDLTKAHVLAIEKLLKDKDHFAYNVGSGVGYSNKEITEMVKKVSGKELEVLESERRPGDADSLVADISKIKQELGFEPKYSDLETIVKTAWEWHKKKQIRT